MNGMHVFSGLLAGTLVALPLELSAHKLAPTGTPEERNISAIRGGWLSDLGRLASLWGVVTFGDPVHEEITNRIYGCDGSICSGLGSIQAPPAVLAGVRWNDDPPFRISSQQGRGTTCKVAETIRFQTQPWCWYRLFRDAEKKAVGGAKFSAAERSAMLYRTHFGDLQFLHAMASADGEAPMATKKQILEWAHFNWLIIQGDLTLETQLKTVDNETIKSAFGYTDWYVQDLYTLGSPMLRAHIKDVAFGSILHTLQDSFAQGHAERRSPLSSSKCQLAQAEHAAPGVIQEFHAYGRQDHDLHAESDSLGAFQEHLQDTPDVVEIGRALLAAYRTGQRWNTVEPYFQCVYAIDGSTRVASPGEQYAASR